MSSPLSTEIKEFYSKRYKSALLILFLFLWGFVIFFKQGGQSLVIHYIWPFIVAFAIVILFNKKWLKNKAGLLNLFALLGLTFFFISFLFDLTPSDGSLELMNIGCGTLLALTLSKATWEEKHWNLLFVGMIIIVTITNLWAIIIYAGGHPFDRLAGPLIKPYEAFSAFPNLLANLNLMIIFPLVNFFTKTKKLNRAQNSFFAFCFIIAISSLILTYSRAAIYSATIVIAFTSLGLFVVYRKRLSSIHKYFKYIVYCLIIIFISLGVVYGINNIRSTTEKTVSIEEKLTFTSEDNTSSVSERIVSVKRGVDMVISRPLTGTGSGSFNYISQSHEKDFITLSSYPYSFPVKFLAENGLPAFLFIFLTIMGIILKRISTKKVCVFVGVISVIILLLHHIIDNNMDFFAASFPLFLIMGMIWPKTKKGFIPNKIIISVITLLTLLGILFVAHEGYYGKYYVQARNFAGANDHMRAFELYEKSENMLFKRDARLAAALSAFTLVEKDKNWITKAKEKALLYIGKDNPLDMRGALLMAKIAYYEKDFKTCLDYVANAKRTGGENNFESDYFHMVCSDKNDLAIFSSEIKPKLEAYLDLLKVNAHMTVLTDNPRYAVKILEELRKYNYGEFEKLYENMYITATEEKQKFHILYNIEAEIKL